MGMAHRLATIRLDRACVSKPFIINPWMLDLADRLVAYARANRLPFPTSHQWGFLEGLRRADQDVDRTPGKWRDGWNAASRQALQQAQVHRHARRSAHPPCSFHDLGQNPHPTNRLVFEREAGGGLSKQLAAGLIEVRESHQQAWIALPEMELPSASARQAALRLGAAWWVCAPARPLWDAYAHLQVEWGHVVLRSPEWDQWVWPWANLIEQGLRLCMMGKKPSASRFVAPEGCAEGKPAAWGSLAMRAWQGADGALDGGWEDMWIGLLCASALNPPALADQALHAINGTQGE